MADPTEKKEEFPRVVSQSRTIALDKMYAGRVKPTAIGSSAHRVRENLHLAQMAIDHYQPEKLLSTEDVELERIMLYASNMSRYNTLRREEVKFTRILDFCEGENEVCMDEKGDLYEVRKLVLHEKNSRKLYNIAVKNWIRKYPTTRWYIDEITGEAIDLHHMQKIINERKKTGLVQYPENPATESAK